VPPRLTRDPLATAALHTAVADDGHGAVVLFVGTVRQQHAGHEVRQIDYSAYETMAETVLRRIERQVGERHGCRLRIHHRLGSLPVGEASVVIAAGSAHRDAAFAACREALERLKREAPIWKREHYADGSTAWREEEPLVATSPLAGPAK
jgi:molybdopterin synthase catalytic subunit